MHTPGLSSILVVAPVSRSLWVSVTDTRSIINRGRRAAQVMAHNLWYITYGTTVKLMVITNEKNY